MPFAGRHVVLGVSGGIACYKSCILARRLTEACATVDVALTAAATEFVRPLTFEALTGRPVLTSLWERGRALAHIDLAKHPDLIILAPATANTLARCAMGMADDLLTALLLARADRPVLAAPAMNDAMYANPATTANITALTARGWHFVGPEIGALAEGPSERPGRMSEPDVIFAAAERLRDSRTDARAPRPGARDYEPLERSDGVRAGGGGARARRRRRPRQRADRAHATGGSRDDPRRDDGRDAARTRVPRP